MNTKIKDIASALNTANTSLEKVQRARGALSTLENENNGLQQIRKFEPDFSEFEKHFKDSEAKIYMHFLEDLAKVIGKDSSIKNFFIDCLNKTDKADDEDTL